MVHSILSFFLIVFIGEIVAFLVFMPVRKWFTGYWFTDSFDNNSRDLMTIVGKGILERVFIFTLLIFDHPQVLILFGALKIGTRFKGAKESKISNDYFLVGNLISVLLSFVYYVTFNAL